MAQDAQKMIDTITAGYTFETPTIHLGAAIVDGVSYKDAAVKLPVGMMNRHGLIAGATGTGKTVTLQVMAEQLSLQGVPVFVSDIKGDVTGLSTAGVASDKLAKRTAEIGQDWQARSFPVEYYALGGNGKGIPVRATISDFGPILLSRVMDLNETQESSLQLVFHYADQKGLELFDLKDLRAVIQFLTSDAGKPELEALGGLSKATAGVILRELVALEAQGMDKFFGEPEFDTADLLRVTPDGLGVISCLELPTMQQKPALFSTFMMWLVADLFAELPEVGDPEKPKLVFFLDEAHLLFRGASKAFLESIMTTVRLIRSKGVGIFFVTQTPKDVPSDVLSQLANRVQHALRAFTPDDAKALKATVSTFPKSEYDLEETLTSAGIGEAVITVMNEKGAPTPVVWTKMFAPLARMGASDAAVVDGIVAASPLLPKYKDRVDNPSAFEKLASAPTVAPSAGSGAAGAGAAGTGGAAPNSGGAPVGGGTSLSDTDAEARRIEEEILGRPSTRPAPAPTRSAPTRSAPPVNSAPRSQSSNSDFGAQLANMAGQVGKELLRGLFSTRKRRRKFW